MMFRVALAVCLLAAGALAQDASCVLQGYGADAGIGGTIDFTFNSDTNETTMDVQVTGITTNANGSHAIFIYTYGDMTTQSDPTSFGDVYEGGLCAPPCFGCQGVNSSFFMGNTGNWNAASGVISGQKNLTLALSGLSSIVGRGLGIFPSGTDCAQFPTGPFVASCVVGLYQNSRPANGSGSVGASDSATSNSTICIVKNSPETVTGVVFFESQGVASNTTVTARVAGLANNSVHGLQIYSYGEFSVTPANIGRYPGGDMGNIYFHGTNGTAYYLNVNSLIKTGGVGSIIGRSCVVETAANCGNPTTYSGLASGVIGYAAAGSSSPGLIVGVPSNLGGCSVTTGTTGTTGSTGSTGNPTIGAATTSDSEPVEASSEGGILDKVQTDLTYQLIAGAIGLVLLIIIIVAIVFAKKKCGDDDDYWYDDSESSNGAPIPTLSMAQIHNERMESGGGHIESAGGFDGVDDDPPPPPTDDDPPPPPPGDEEPPPPPPF